MFESPESMAADDETPGARIRRLRIARNMTQRELAGGKYSVSYISALERGRVNATLGILNWCAERLRVPVTVLLGESNANGDEAQARYAAAKLAYEQVHAEMMLTSGETARGRAELEAVRRRMGTTAPRSVVWFAAYGACGDGDIEAAMREAETYLHSIEGQNERDRAATHWLFGMIYGRQGDVARAVAEYQRALELEDLAYFDLDAAMLIRGDLSRLMLAMGDYAAAAELDTEALRAYTDFADPAARARIARERAEESAQMGNWLRAYQLIRWAWNSQREAATRREAAQAYLRSALLAAGEGATALESELRWALTLAEQSGEDETRLLASSMLALTFAERGELIAAREMMSADPPPDDRTNASIQSAAAAALLAAQAWVAHASKVGGREARERAAEAEAALGAAPDALPIFAAAVWMSLSRLYEAADDSTAALKALRRAVAWRRQSPASRGS